MIPNQLQFGGMPEPEPVASRGLSSAQAINATRGTDRTKPVGMRGSVADRAQLDVRRQKMWRNRGVWDSVRTRMEDEDYGGYHEEDLEPHPVTGLQEWGPLTTHEDIGFGRSGFVPEGASFHGGTRAAWRQHGQVGYVPTPLLHTQQHTVSSARVHAIIDDPATGTSPRFPGTIGQELPRVYVDNHLSTEPKHTIVDGNHRLSADRLNGKLFSEARITTSENLPAMNQTNMRINAARREALANPKVSQEEVVKRQNDRFYGTDNW